MPNINYDYIKQIESSGDPNAYNKGSQARGLYQITPIVLTEWNNLNPKEQYTEEQLFTPEVNEKIAKWYMDKRIPQMHKAYNIEDTLENRLTSYNAGIGRTRKGIIPEETKNYIIKYKALEDKLKK